MTKLEEVKAAIPHREPFLFIDEIVECDGKRILCKKTFTGEEFFFQGHYPDYPIVPGVILCEAAMQAGAILLTKIFTDEDVDHKIPVAAKMSEVRFKQSVRPGDTILLEVKFKDKMTGVYFLRSKVTLNGKTSVQFDFACALTERPE